MQLTRYAYLDGIRGIAALFVVARHSNLMLGMATYRSHLAVDLFFLLSGFVIAHAYEARLRTGAISFKDFVRIRIIRLYPVYLVSVVFAVAVALAALGAVQGKLNGGTLAEVSAASVLTLFFLPSSLSWSDYLFPLNSVYWSLFFELAVNFIYALALSRLTDGVLKAVALVAALVCAVLALRTGTLDHGFMFNVQSVVGGLARSAFGFSVGVLFYRNREKLAALMTGRFWPAAGMVTITAVLASPSIPGLNGVIELLCIFVLIPIAVLGLAFQQPRAAVIERTMTFLGNASYPLYVLHGPMVFLTYRAVKRLGPQFMFPAGVAMVAGLIAAAVILERWFDPPVRRWINARWAVRRGTAQITPASR
ncbi:MAG TPA: acyltransferase [Pseudoduganella sp.]|jgi:peptidoglycan/LPS O-acetylase OafA/YrhL